MNVMKAAGNRSWDMMLDLAGDYDDATVGWQRLQDLIPKSITSANINRASQLEDPRAQLGPGPISNPQGWLWMQLPEKKTDWYSKDMMKQFAEAAKRHGVDPLTYIALGVAETQLGNVNPTNPAMIYPVAHPAGFGTRKKLYGDKAETPEASIDYGARLLHEGYKRFPKDELAAIQSYSGTGRTIYSKPKADSDTVTPKITSKSRYFGRPVKSIDFWKEKPQAHRVQEIAKALRQNKEFMQYLDEMMKHYSNH